MLQFRLTDANGVHTVLVTGPRVTIGTAAECELQINAADAAPEHAILQQQQDGWLIRDLKTRTGTLVGQQRVPAAGVRIKPGQSIRIGLAELTVETPELPASLPFPHSGTKAAADYSRLLRQTQDGDDAAAADLYREAIRRGDAATAAWAIPFASPDHNSWAALVLALNAWPRHSCKEVVEHVATILERRSWPHRILTAPTAWWGNVRDSVQEPRMLLARHLYLGGDDVADTLLSQHLARDWLRNVTILTVRCTRAARVLPALADSSMLELATLDLAGVALQTSQLPELVGVLDRMPELERLVLRGCRLTDEGVRQLVRMQQLRQLNFLDLSRNGLGDDAAMALARSPNVVNLRRLDLRGHNFSLDGIRRMRMSVRFQDGALLYD